MTEDTPGRALVIALGLALVVAAVLLVVGFYGIMRAVLAAAP